MIKKILAKATAGTAAAGLVLVPMAAVSGPQFVNVACDYPNSVATSTDVRLTAVAAPYGTRNVATVDVASNAGTPQGTVRLRVVGKADWTLQLDKNGVASKRLPRTLDAGATYRVRADYQGQCDWMSSRDTINYTVEKARVNVNPAATSPKKAIFEARFRGNGGVDPQVGAARFVVKDAKGKIVRRTKTGVTKGYASVDLKNIKKKGAYTLRVRYLGSPNFEKGAGAVRFTVGRVR